MVTPGQYSSLSLRQNLPRVLRRLPFLPRRDVPQGAFISTVTRAGCWLATVTLAETLPRRSCHTCSWYSPGGMLSNVNCPSEPVIASKGCAATTTHAAIQG